VPKTVITEEHQRKIQELKDSHPGYYLYTDEDLIRLFIEPKKEKPETNLLAQDYQKERKDWEKFYKDNFNEKVDFTKVRIPNLPTKEAKRDYRLLIIKQGLTLEATFQKCKKLFNAYISYIYTDKPLDDVVTQNSRTPTTHYAIWVRNTIEQDPEYLGKSTKDADPDMKIGITLLERLILELKHYQETKQHLDIKGAIFCTGSRSRHADGFVPSVYWNDDSSRLWVSCFPLGYCYSEYGLRRAVS
jgi:hypothetical protein